MWEGTHDAALCMKPQVKDHQERSNETEERTRVEVDGDDEDDEDGVEDDGVQIIAQEGGGEAVGEGVCGNADWWGWMGVGRGCGYEDKKGRKTVYGRLTCDDPEWDQECGGVDAHAWGKVVLGVGVLVGRSADWSIGHTRS